ncbi:MAG: hypothetical protein WKF77_20200 [Planctomycetaceae bacterium]
MRKRLGYVDPPPDPAVIRTLFSHAGFRQTLFLLRVLKTFAENPDGTKSPAKNTGDERPPAVAASRKMRLAAKADDIANSEIASLLTNNAADNERARREP